MHPGQVGGGVGGGWAHLGQLGEEVVEVGRPSASVLPNDGYMVGWRSSDDGMAVCGVVEGANVNRSTVEGDELVGGGDSMIGT